MISDFEPKKSNISFLYYVVSDKELEWISSYQFRDFPERFFIKPFMAPTLSISYARKWASEKNNWNGTENSHILRFLMHNDSIKLFMTKGTDPPHSRTSLIVPKEKLETFNSFIIGYLEKYESYSLKPEC